MGLQEYLAYCAQALERLLEFPMVHIVIGNESCDLDSAVSAITYAYYLHETSTAPVGTALFLPLLNIPRSDFPLRTEITYFLGKFDLTATDLVFKDDLNLGNVRAKTDLKLTLVDHHVLGGDMSDFEENVVQIIDHRPKDGSLPDQCESVLELVGSCCTLVAETLLADETFTIDPVSTTLLYGTIVTDTINFSHSAGKATPKDLDLAERLEDSVDGGIDRDSLFEEIRSAKFDLSGLSVKEILRKDLKLVSGDSLTVAMSSVTMEMKALMEREDFASGLKEFAVERKVDAVVVLTVCCGRDDNVTRQLAVFSPSRVYRQQMADVLNTTHSPNLGLSPLSSTVEEFLSFSQSNVKASRKQILPIVKSFLAGETTPDETQMDAFDLPKEQSEGFTSMSSIVGSRQNTSDGDITSEDLTSRENSTETDFSTDDKLLTEPRKVFDPLSSVHSSDGDATSPTTGAIVADDHVENVLPISEEMNHFNHTNEEADSGELANDAESSNPIVNAGEFSHVEFSTNSPSPLVEEVSDNPAGVNQNNADPIHINGLPEDHDLLEQDILNMASPHDLLFPTDSPLDVSAATSGQGSGQTSGQTSGHASKAPSYPVTPPNSYMEDGVVDKEVQLPSFNSSEMVEKIHEKKAALGASGSEDTEPMSPFTPQNSYVDTSFPSAYGKETQLPSFHSSDMVERIREKRSSMERDVQGAGVDSDTLLDVGKNAFTPHNSFVDATFEKYARENLPSLNNAEIANRIKERQAELTAAAGQDSGTASPVGGLESSISPAAPYTPQNSFRESHIESLEQDFRVTDLNEVAERLSLTGSESSGSLNEPKAVKASNKVHMQGLSPQEAVSFNLFETEESAEAASQVEQNRDSNIDVSSASMGVKRKGVSFSQPGEDASAEEAIQKVAYELANEMIQKALETFPSESVKELVPEAAASGESRIGHPSISEDSSPTMDESDRDLTPDFQPRRSQERDASDSALASSTDSELFTASFAAPAHSAMKMSSSLADELAQALNKDEDDENLEIKTDNRMDESNVSSKANTVSHKFEEKTDNVMPSSRLSVTEREIPKSESYEIETEYLSDMDPMQRMGGVLHQDANIIETDADKEVVEGASFRKISGQEYQTVQEEILEQIRQEAKDRENAKRRQSSVVEEDETSDNETDKSKAQTTEDKKIIAPEVDLNLDESLTDEQGKKTIHVIRDRELYAIALENENTEMEDPSERTLQASDSFHPLQDTLPQESQFDDGAKKKIVVSGSDQFQYESFAETGSLGNTEEERRRYESGEGRESEEKVSMARAASTTSEGGLKGVELCDEWQDDELPKILGENGQPLEGAMALEETQKRLVPEEGLAGTGDSLEHMPVVESDSEVDSDMDNEQLEWENDTPVRTPVKPKVAAEAIPEYSAAEERRDALSWKTVSVGEGEEFRLDMKVIEPYKRVLSHGGYCGEGLTAMIVFSACYLPSRDRKDYSYVMNHLFHYVIHTLDELVADDYMIVYFHGATPRRQMPSFSWLKRCYHGIDRRLKKNLKALYLVHPTLWIKTVVMMTRPFISAKFSSKLQFVRTLNDLRQMIPMEYVYVPEIVQRYDDRHFHPDSPPSSPSQPSSPEQQP